jgi:hypothetical protein
VPYVPTANMTIESKYSASMARSVQVGVFTSTRLAHSLASDLGFRRTF